MNEYLNEIINNYFNTDKGILYLVDLIREKYPNFNINEDNLKNLSIVEMDVPYFEQTGFVGEYVADKKVIKVVKKETLSKYGSLFTDRDIIDTFLHELLHALTTKIDKDNGFILEGINLRRILDNNNSYFLSLNEGITQYFTNDLLDITDNDAYVFESKVAELLSLIVGKESLIESYSNNNINSFLSNLNGLSEGMGQQIFVANIYFISAFFFSATQFLPRKIQG